MSFYGFIVHCLCYAWAWLNTRNTHTDIWEHLQ